MDIGQPLFLHLGTDPWLRWKWYRCFPEVRWLGIPNAKALLSQVQSCDIDRQNDSWFDEIRSRIDAEFGASQSSLAPAAAPAAICIDTPLIARSRCEGPDQSIDLRTLESTVDGIRLLLAAIGDRSDGEIPGRPPVIATVGDPWLPAAGVIVAAGANVVIDRHSDFRHLQISKIGARHLF